MIESQNKNGPIILVSKNINYIFPSGYGYLAGYLVEHGENIKVLLRPDEKINFPDLVKKIIELKPLAVGFGSIYPDLYATKEIIALLNLADRNFPIIIGGQMVSPTPEFAVEITGADIGVIGEGEIVLYNLVKALRAGTNPTEVKGLILNLGAEKKLTGPGEYIDDLSKLPRIPYELFPSTEWINVGRFYLNLPQPHNQYKDRTITIHGGRGCPFRCNFCYHHSRARYRPIQDMLKEVEESVKKFKANLVYFDDDLAIISPQRALDLATGMKNLPHRVEYSVSARFDILEKISDDVLIKMKQSGLRCMNLGVESGSQRILDIIDKKITVQQMINGFKRLKRIGILPNACIMVGQLSETSEDVQKSMDLMIEGLKINKNMNWAFSITTPFPGSKLYDICFAKGIFKSHYDFYNRLGEEGSMGKLAVNLTAMPDDEVIAWMDKFKQTWKIKRREAVGPRVAKLENLRIRADRFNKKLHKKIFNRLPNNIIGFFINKIYNYCYDLMQILFDEIRLKLLGVKKY